MPTPFLSNFEEEAKLETMALGPDDAFDAFYQRAAPTSRPLDTPPSISRPGQ